MGRAGRASRDAAAGDGIQFVAPRTELFGAGPTFADGDDDHAIAEAFADDDEEGRPARWTTALAGLGVASLIAVGVVAAAPWDDEAAPPTTSAPPTSAPTTTAADDTATTEAPVVTAPGEDPFAVAAAGGPPVGFLLDPTAMDGGHVLQVILPQRLAVGDVPFAWLDVWATPGAGSLTGDWVAVEVDPWPTTVSEGAAERIDLGGRTGVLDRGGPFPQLSFPVGDRTVSVTASGWSTEQMQALAAQLDVVDGRPVYTGGGVEGHDLVASHASPGWGLYAELRSQAESVLRWETADGTAFVSVSTRPADDDADRALRRLLGAPVDGWSFTGPDARVVVGGRVVTIDQPLDDVTTVEATFDEGGRTVTVAQNDGDVDALLELLDPTHLRAGTSAEWLDLARDVFVQDDAPPPDTAALGEVLVTSGSLPDGSPWTLSSFDAGVGAPPWYGVSVYAAGDSPVPTWTNNQAGPVPSVSLAPAGALATVIVDASSGAVALQAGPPGGEMTTVDLVPVPPDSDGVPEGADLLVGVLRFDVIGPWIAQTVDAAGLPVGQVASDGTSTSATAVP